MNHSFLLNRQEFGSPENKGSVMSMDDAMALLKDWVKNEKLLFHMRQVGHLMKKYAESQGYDPEMQHMWHLAGLLHDAD